MPIVQKPVVVQYDVTSIAQTLLRSTPLTLTTNCLFARVKAQGKMGDTVIYLGVSYPVGQEFQVLPGGVITAEDSDVRLAIDLYAENGSTDVEGFPVVPVGQPALLKSIIAQGGGSALAAEPSGWTLLSLPAGITSSDAAVRIDGDTLQFRGTLSGTITTGLLIATLPTSFPAIGTTTSAACVSSTGIMIATANVLGEIRAGTVSGSPTSISLTGLSAPRLFAENKFVAVTPTLPVVYVETMGQEIPAPATVTVYILGFITVVGTDNIPSIARTAIDISGHGNSTWSGLTKRSLKLRFPTSTSILGMPADRAWRALSNGFDVTQIRNAVAFELARRVSPVWVPRNEFCELFVDGEYRGLYQMTESIRSGTNRLPVTLASSSATGLAATGAFILEVNTRYIFEGLQGFTTARGVMIQYDDPSNPPAGQKTYLETWIGTFETALYAGTWLDPVLGYAKYVDMNSFADWYIVNELIVNNDSGFFSSCKMYKTADTATVPGRLFMGPTWDHDLSLGNGYNAAANVIRDWQARTNIWWTRNALWLQRMMLDPAFVKVLGERWALHQKALYEPDGVIAWATRTARKVSRAAASSAVRWGFHNDSETRTGMMLEWLSRRVQWFAPKIVEPTLRNLFVNPRPNVDLNGYFMLSGIGTLSRPAGNPLGGNSVRVTWPGPEGGYVGFYLIQSLGQALPAGSSVTVVAMIRSSKLQNVVYYNELKGDSNNRLAINDAVTIKVQANVLTRIEMVLRNIPAGVFNIIPLIAYSSSIVIANGDWLEINGVMLVNSDQPGIQYSDPGTDGLWQWEGTAFASTSLGWPA